MHLTVRETRVLEGVQMRLHRFLLTLLLALTWVVVALAAEPGDTSALKPPAGSKVAIVVFEDLQCPDCARAAPLVKDVSKAEKIPVVRHDFPLPIHNWSYQAAVIARYFDTKSKALGAEWREFCFANHPAI